MIDLVLILFLHFDFFCFSVILNDIYSTRGWEGGVEDTKSLERLSTKVIYEKMSKPSTPVDFSTLILKSLFSIRGNQPSPIFFKLGLP